MRELIATASIDARAQVLSVVPDGESEGAGASEGADAGAATGAGSAGAVAADAGSAGEGDGCGGISLRSSVGASGLGARPARQVAIVNAPSP